MTDPSTNLKDQRGHTGTDAASLRAVALMRSLFWQNVMREMLSSLAMISGKQSGLPGVVDATGAPVDADLFDGRLAVVTRLGQRIPIAAVSPLFACGIASTLADRCLSSAVECTVFQIQTPGGEVFTLPLHEIQGFHSLNADLIERLKDATRNDSTDGDISEPFGFAAYTSLTRTKFPAGVLAPYQFAENAEPAD